MKLPQTQLDQTFYIETQHEITTNYHEQIQLC